MSDLRASQLTCEYKTSFSDLGQALQHIKMRKKRDGATIRAYVCENCGNYHPTGNSDFKVKFKPSGSGRKPGKAKSKNRGPRKNGLRKDKLW